MLARPLTISAIVTGLLAMINVAAAAQGDMMGGSMTQSSDMPDLKAPALLPASSMGDRAFVIFANPAEIGSFIENRC
jgi:hypothetical protein